ncbi:MAG: type II toxin-antitoxin system RelE/ParE family toxin [Planctomycetaceae bacterium]|nr:type II toxin-antitoxin system RelE/ParE family toxin [Planctomycetaceae bacterium]
MTLPVELSAAAVQDIREIKGHYTNIRPALGWRFVDHLERVHQSIASMPESFDPVMPNYRRAFIPKFPHIVYFRVDANRIVIVAVLHSARHSREWKQRLSDGF